MNAPAIRRHCRLAFLLGFLTCVCLAAATPEVAIYVRTYNDYTRTQLPDESFKPETFTFAEGGRIGGYAGDVSLDKLSFHDILRHLADPLKKRGYVASFDKKNIDLIIMVFWGMTTGAQNGQFDEGRAFLSQATQAFKDRPSAQFNAEIPGRFSTNAGLDGAAESAMEQAMMMQSLANAERDRNNAINARLLGFKGEFDRAMEIPWFSLARDAIAEVEEDRYFVLLKAFDYESVMNKKPWKLMWDARFSIPAQGNAFNEQLPAMIKRASEHFGDNIEHLMRDSGRKAKVKVGTPTVVEPDQK